ncbi:hypothetical protein [Myxosarcina sp. GI1(2024)]
MTEALQSFYRFLCLTAIEVRRNPQSERSEMAGVIMSILNQLHDCDNFGSYFVLPT